MLQICACLAFMLAMMRPPPQEILSDVNRRRVGKASLGVQAAHYFGAGALLCRSQTLSLHL
jgi:hypothetical protein